MKKLYVVRLSEQERAELTKLINTGRAAAYRRRHAQILLEADQGEHGRHCMIGRSSRNRRRAPVLLAKSEAQLRMRQCGRLTRRRRCSIFSLIAAGDTSLLSTAQ